jgi:hypothetical protein
VSLKTVKIEVKLLGPDALPIIGASVEAVLSVAEVDGGIIIPSKVKAVTDSTGIAILNLWPNARGSGASNYNVKASSFKPLLDVVIYVPDVVVVNPISIGTLLNSAPYPTLDASQTALIAVQASAVQSLQSAINAAASAASVDINLPAVAAAYVSSINNVQELRALFLQYMADHP